MMSYISSFIWRRLSVSIQFMEMEMSCPGDSGRMAQAGPYVMRSWGVPERSRIRGGVIHSIGRKGRYFNIFCDGGPFERLRAQKDLDSGRIEYAARTGWIIYCNPA